MNTHSAQTNLLFTIGHSNLEIADFLSVLAAHGVRTLCDVRSRPASFRFPQFNREPEDPLQCHRFLMICTALLEHGISPVHIRRGGALESQSEAEDRLLVLHGFDDVTSTSLFVAGREAALRDALVLQSKDFAFRASPEAAEYL